MNTKTLDSETHDAVPSNWIRRMGLAGFSFFMIKGLLWLILPLIARAALAGT